MFKPDLKYILLLPLFLLFQNMAFAQPANDDCENPIDLPDVTNWCSNNAEYSNIDATLSGYDAASCFNVASNDVWFSFTAASTDVTITINGNQAIGAGGTLNNPEVTLYYGTCGGTVNELGCADGAGFAELYKGGLLVGADYLIRVQGTSGAEGTFQLCINNYNPPVNPGSDCPTSAVLCDKSSFVVQQVIGAGTNPDEANGTCLGLFGNSESNSTWFTWICETSGTLSFDLIPLNPPDDLDFVVYRLPNGIDNCAGKIEERCCASGSFDFPSPCMGPTGLSEASTDNSEPAGCNDASQDNYVNALDMVAGEAYALIINNFSGTGNGFNISFGGSGTFLGPQPAFTASPSVVVCYGETMIVNDNSSFALGTLINWEWSFGEGATPPTATGIGPHAVTWETPGLKPIVLTVESDLGCIITEIDEVLVEPCCNDENAMTVTPSITDLLCSNIEDGEIMVDVVSNADPYIYEWSGPNGFSSSNPDISGLGLGDYTITITNDATCDTILTYTVDGPPPIEFDFDIVMPTCMGGQDGSISLNVFGGVSPFMYNWENTGFASDNTLTDLAIGIYDVTIQDANDCEVPLSIEVNELELVLNSDAATVTPPSCYDSFDGTVVLDVANGAAPYMFDWNDGLGFVNTNSIGGINNGMFNITFVDANGCFGDTMVIVQPPTPVSLEMDTTNVSCFGFGDGFAVVQATGGVGGYSYQWSNGQTDSMAVDLVPGQYDVTVMDANGCDTTAGVFIIEPPELFIDVINVVDVICHGDETGTISVLGSGGNPDYEYSLDGFNFQTDTLFSELGAGDYVIYVMDMLGCTDSVMASVFEPPPLIVDAGEDQTVDLGYSAELNAVHSPPFRPVDFIWEPMDYLDCFDCPDPTATPPNTTTYSVTITDETGCTATDEVTVFIVKNRPIYIPNVFSPNQDGFNDYFTAYGGPAATNIRVIRVFNRWGALVFEGEDIPLGVDIVGWDGTFRDKPVGPDVFAFYIVIGFIDDESILYEGSITIVR